MSSSLKPLTPEAKQTITVLRALTVSRKGPTTLKELIRDYRSLEGDNNAHQKYGFKSMEDLLNASGEFSISKIQGEICIVAKPCKDSAHITEMVKRQRAPRRKSATPPFRKPKTSDQSWNKSSYSSNVFQKLPSYSSPTKRRKGDSNRSTLNTNSATTTNRKTGDNNNNNNQANRNNNKQSKQQQQQQQQKQQQERSNQNLKTQQQQQQKQSSQEQYRDLREKLNAKQQPKSPDLREQINAKKQATTTTAATGTGVENNKSNQNAVNGSILRDRLQKRQIQTINKISSQTKSIDIRQQENNHSVSNTGFSTSNLSKRLQRIANNAVKSNQNPITIDLTINDDSNWFVDREMDIKTSSPVTPEKSAPDYLPRKFTSIQDRLHLKIAASATSNGNTGITQQENSPSIISNNSSVIDMELNKTKEDVSKPIIPPIKFEFNPKLDPITSLAQYCTVRRYPQPDYKSLKSKFSGLYQCRVLVNGIMYSTYPNEYPAEALAQIACAVNAIDEIKVMESKNEYPACSDSDVELAMKIHQELKNHPHGIFCKNIPEMFENTFKQTLPEHWLSIIQSSDQFIMEEATAVDNMIVYANETAESSAASITSDTEFIVLDKITLPWESRHWNLYITYCVSTVDIWARIVGTDYSDQLDSLMNDIDVYMLTDKSRPMSISVGQVYLICLSECWHRVRVEDMNKPEGKCFCFFLDFGDEEWLAMDQLYVCETRFLKLPPQAIPFSLFGLEDFAENPNAKRHLDIMLIGKSLVGEILTKRESFESTNLVGDDFNAKIQVVLYDTSSSEDINLNPLLLNKICDDTPPPELKRSELNNVNVTHVNMNGEIFLQLRNPGLLYVQKLINQLVESKFKEDQHKVSEDDMKRSNLFLVQDGDDKRWYRGALTEGGCKIDSNTYNIFYVDFGIIKPIKLSRIFRLDSLSAALSKFPRQVIKAKLHDIPPINAAKVARIKGLLPADCLAIAKVSVIALVPLVIIYRRFDPNQGYVNVNEVIRIEHEIESNSIIETLESDKTMNSLYSNAKGRYDLLASEQNMISEMASVMRGISLKSPTVPSSPQRRNFPKLSSYVDIPSIGSFFNVLVTMASNPNNFVVQPYDDGPKLVDLMAELQEYCSNNDEFIPADMLEEGQAYAALNSDGNYLRVTVENIFESSMIHVHYCDFGDIAVISNEKLKTLPAKFRTLPKQAIAAKLYGVKPKHVDWTLDDCMRFKELTVGQKFVSIIKDITTDAVSPNTKILEIELIDVSTEDDIYIHKILINEGRAVASSET